MKSGIKMSVYFALVLVHITFLATTEVLKTTFYYLFEILKLVKIKRLIQQGTDNSC